MQTTTDQVGDRTAEPAASTSRQLEAKAINLQAPAMLPTPREALVLVAVCPPAAHWNRIIMTLEVGYERGRVA